ncbi:MAG: hypothetical protein LBS92_04865 [Candidatus Methanoplasma sp.]|jgi:KEOPS complex subunit Cgi121|nr:hypothetical protein [Candidatus Methanoplasma sp.]
MRDVLIIGVSSNVGFDGIVEHFTGLGGEVVLLDPSMVCGRDHIVSAVAHADRAFARGANRSKTILTEVILYAAGDRQIGRATERMRPKGNDVVAVLFGISDPKLDAICAERRDDLFEPSADKALALGVSLVDGIPPEDLVLEHVAMVDLMKQ